MNIHPLFVHFPIGILTLYVFFEVLRFHFIMKRPYYFELKAVLVIFGTAAAFFAATTGDMAEELSEAGQNTVVSASEMSLVETHALFAMATVTVFSILAGSYLFEYIRKHRVLKILTHIRFLRKVSNLIQKSSFILAIVGMLLVTIAGALGASIVYGPDIDPVVTVIYYLVMPLIQ